MPIGQISFMRMDGPVERPYGSEDAGSKYQGQAEPTPSRFHLNFERRAASPIARPSDLTGAGRRYHLTDAEYRTTRDSRRADHRPVVFGPKRLPELGRSLGKGIREFKGSVTGDNDEDDEDEEMRELRAVARPRPRPRRSRAR